VQGLRGVVSNLPAVISTGSMLADDEELQIVDSFQSVLEKSDSGKPLNLQVTEM
jgi:hypothetical protein